MLSLSEDLKCLRASQPFGIPATMGYVRKFIGKSAEEQQALLKEPLPGLVHQVSVHLLPLHCRMPHRGETLRKEADP
jgi:hypothetical protein